MNKVSVGLTVNGTRVDHEVEPRTHLGDFLREILRLTSVHLGCEHGVCGACTVLVDDEPVRSCTILAVTTQDTSVQTLEGMQKDPLIAVLKRSFHEKHGLQCGFCTSGMLLTAWDILSRTPGLSEPELRVALSGNLCRCTGYQGIVRAIRAAQAEIMGKELT